MDNGNNRKRATCIKCGKKRYQEFMKSKKCPNSWRDLKKKWHCIKCQEE